MKNHEIFGLFASWLEESNYYTAQDWVNDDLEILKNLEPIELREVEGRGLLDVKADLYRPHIIINQVENWVYIATYIHKTGNCATEWERNAWLNFSAIKGAPLSTVLDGTCFPNPNFDDYQIRDYDTVIKEDKGLQMVYWYQHQNNLQQWLNSSPAASEYGIHGNNGTWQSSHEPDYNIAYYIDDILGIGHAKQISSINWLFNNPLDKHMKELKRIKMEEAARIAILERKERLNMLIEKNKTYLSRKERKFLKNKLNIINGKAPKGIYFDYNRIDFMFRVLDEDKILQYHLATKNQSRKTTWNYMYNSFNQQGVWPDMMTKILYDVFPEYEFEEKTPTGSYDYRTHNGITPFFHQSWDVFTKDIYESGIDLSYYLVETLPPAYGNANIAENSYCFSFQKPGGPLSKSMYYQDLNNKRKIGNVNALIFLPKWLFIDTR